MSNACGKAIRGHLRSRGGASWPRIQDRGREHLTTVETETHGALTGRRVIRDREWECLAYYGHHAPPATRRPRDAAGAATKGGAEPPWLADFKTWQHQQFHAPASLIGTAAPKRPARDRDDRVGRSVERS